jgi:hypothetical protein
MQPQVPLNIEGVREALAELNKIDPRYRRQITKRIKGAGDEIITQARQMVASYANSEGNGAPLSGMRRGSLVKGREVRWDNKAVQKGFKVRVGVRATRERYVNFNRSDEFGNQYTEQVTYGALPYRIMVIQQADGAGAIFDHAGRRTNNGTFVTNLEAQADVGDQPRVLIPTIERNRPSVERKVDEVIKDVERVTNRNLKRRYGN